MTSLFPELHPPITSPGLLSSSSNRKRNRPSNTLRTRANITTSNNVRTSCAFSSKTDWRKRRRNDNGGCKFIHLHRFAAEPRVLIGSERKLLLPAHRLKLQPFARRFRVPV